MESLDCISVLTFAIMGTPIMQGKRLADGRSFVSDVLRPLVCQLDADFKVPDRGSVNPPPLGGLGDQAARRTGRFR